MHWKNVLHDHWTEGGKVAELIQFFHKIFRLYVRTMPSYLRSSEISIFLKNLLYMEEKLFLKLIYDWTHF